MAGPGERSRPCHRRQHAPGRSHPPAPPLPAAAEAGSIVGEQRIEDITSTPVAFEVLYDEAVIDPSHSYALYASIVDGELGWNSEAPVPVITGGPKTNVELPVAATAAFPATIEGDIVPPVAADLSPDAVAIAVLVKEETGTLVSVATEVEIASGPSVPFSLGYDPDLVDPGSHYVVEATIVDGSRVWESLEPADVIVDGAPATDVQVELAPRAGEIPVPPTPTPEPTIEPTVAPTRSPPPNRRNSPRPNRPRSRRPNRPQSRRRLRRRSRPPRQSQRRRRRLNRHRRRPRNRPRPRRRRPARHRHRARHRVHHRAHHPRRAQRPRRPRPLRAP